MNINRLVNPIWPYLVLPIPLYAIASAGGGDMNSLRECLMLILFSSLGVRQFCLEVIESDGMDTLL